MKLTVLTASIVILSAGYAFAGAGAPVPEGSQNPPPSGRPSATLVDTACQSAWKMASPNGDTLSKDKATPFVVNYEMVDTDKGRQNFSVRVSSWPWQRLDTAARRGNRE